MKKIILILLFIFSFLNADITQYFPKLEGRIIDQVNLLSPAMKNDINSILKDHEKLNDLMILILPIKQEDQKVIFPDIFRIF